MYRTPQDYCLYYGVVDGHLVFVEVFENDTFSACTNLDIISQVKQYFFLQVSRNDILGVWINQDEVSIQQQRADILTKALDGSSFDYYLDYFMYVVSVTKF